MGPPRQHKKQVLQDSIYTPAKTSFRGKVPMPFFRPYKGFWGSKNYWAPECHVYQGKYYLFATFFDTTANLRGTTILVADQHNGPFTEHAIGRITPQEWGALDGTLYIDRQGNPWMVFCHEWTQIGDGTVEALPLQKDLKSPCWKTRYII